MPGVIVPRKTVGELQKLLEDADGAITSACRTPRSSSASTASNYLQTDDGNFPPYERVIPAATTRCWRWTPGISRRAWTASTISADKTRACKLGLAGQGDPHRGQSRKRQPPPKDVGATTARARWRSLQCPLPGWTLPGQIEGKEVRFLAVERRLGPPSSRTQATRATL